MAGGYAIKSDRVRAALDTGVLVLRPRELSAAIQERAGDQASRVLGELNVGVGEIWARGDYTFTSCSPADSLGRGRRVALACCGWAVVEMREPRETFVKSACSDEHHARGRVTNSDSRTRRRCSGAPLAT